MLRINSWHLQFAQLQPTPTHAWANLGLNTPCSGATWHTVVSNLSVAMQTSVCFAPSCMPPNCVCRRPCRGGRWRRHCHCVRPSPRHAAAPAQAQGVGRQARGAGQPCDGVFGPKAHQGQESCYCPAGDPCAAWHCSQAQGHRAGEWGGVGWGLVRGWGWGRGGCGGVLRPQSMMTAVSC